MCSRGWEGNVRAGNLIAEIIAEVAQVAGFRAHLAMVQVWNLIFELMVEDVNKAHAWILASFMGMLRLATLI